MDYLTKAKACPPYGSELLKNYNFEQNFAFWNGSNDTIIRIPKLIYKGQGSALIGTNSNKPAYLRQGKIFVGPGCGLRLSVLARKAIVAKDTIMLVRLSFQGKTGKNIGMPTELRIPGTILPGVYVPFFTEVTTPRNTASVAVTVGKLGTGSILVDNISLISVPPIA